MTFTNIISTLQNKKVLKTIFVFAIILSSFVFAKQAFAVRLSPVRTEYQIDPGQSVTGELKITNTENRDLNLYTSAQIFQAQGESGSPILVDSSDGFPSWVSMEPVIFIKKGETKKLPYTITVPANAQPGGNFGALVLSPQNNSGKGNVVIGSKIATLVFLRVSGDIKEEGGIVSFKHEHNTFGVLPVHFSYRFSNQGADRLFPKGVVTIRNIFGLRIKRFDANPVEGNVLPESIRRYDISWNRANDRAGETTALVPVPEKLSFFKTVNYQLHHFAFGVFFARLKLDYGFDTVMHGAATRLFIVFPWQLFVCSVVVLGLLVLLLKPLIKKYHQTIINRYEKNTRKNQ